MFFFFFKKDFSSWLIIIFIAVYLVQVFVLNCHYSGIVCCLKTFSALCSETPVCSKCPISLIPYSTTSFTVLLLQALALLPFHRILVVLGSSYRGNLRNLATNRLPLPHLYTESS